MLNVFFQNGACKIQVQHFGEIMLLGKIYDQKTGGDRFPAGSAFITARLKSKSGWCRGTGRAISSMGHLTASAGGTRVERTTWFTVPSRMDDAGAEAALSGFTWEDQDACLETEHPSP
jgi:hypothetical protein